MFGTVHPFPSEESLRNSETVNSETVVGICLFGHNDAKLYAM